MTEVWVLCAVLALLAFGWVLKSRQGRWLAPGPMLAAHWALFLAGPALFAPEFVISPAAVWCIVALVSAFCLGSWAAANQPPVRSANAIVRPVRVRLLRQLVLSGTVAGCLAGAVIQYANGYSFKSILTLTTLLDSAVAIIEGRYTGTIAVPAAVPILLAFTYAAALVAPFAAHGLRKPLALACYLGPVFGATIYASATTARSGIVTAAAFLFAGWVASRAWRTGETPKLGLRGIATGLTSAALIVLAFGAIAMLRLGDFSSRYYGDVLDALAVYAFGYLPAFGYWLPEASAWPTYWGTGSYSGVLEWLTGDTGLSADLAEQAPLGNGQDTNIYTAWRYIIEDFGLAGALFFTALLGFLVTAAWVRLIQRPSALALIGFLALYAELLHTNTLPIFTFTNVAVAVAIAGVALHLRPRPPKFTAESPHDRDVRRVKERASLLQSGEQSVQSGESVTGEQSGRGPLVPGVDRGAGR